VNLECKSQGRTQHGARRCRSTLFWQSWYLIGHHIFKTKQKMWSVFYDWVSTHVRLRRRFPPRGKSMTSSGGSWFECRLAYVFVFVLLIPCKCCISTSDQDKFHTLSCAFCSSSYEPEIKINKFAVCLSLHSSNQHNYVLSLRPQIRVFFQIFLPKTWLNIQSGAAFSYVQWQCSIGLKLVLLLPCRAAWKRNKSLRYRCM